MAPHTFPFPFPASLQRVRASRDQAAVDAVLARLEAAAHSGKRDENLLALAVEAARLRCVAAVEPGPLCALPAVRAVVIEVEPCFD